MASEELTGRVFSKWTVLQKSKKAGYYKCRCECGRVKNVAARNLLNGKSRSCMSCANSKPNPLLAQRFFEMAKEKEGQTIHGWYVIEVLPEKKNGNYLCRTICPTCGKEVITRLSNLTYNECCENCPFGIPWMKGKIYKNSHSGITGVRQVKNGHWTAGIRFQGKYYHLGTYATVGEATAARKQAEEMLLAFLHNQYDGTDADLKSELGALREKKI